MINAKIINNGNILYLILPLLRCKILKSYFKKNDKNLRYRKLKGS